MQHSYFGKAGSARFEDISVAFFRARLTSVRSWLVQAGRALPSIKCIGWRVHKLCHATQLSDTWGVFGSLYRFLAPLHQRDGPPCASWTDHGPWSAGRLVAWAAFSAPEREARPHCLVARFHYFLSCSCSSQPVWLQIAVCCGKPFLRVVRLPSTE
jgi:hypothetical protein